MSLGLNLLELLLGKSVTLLHKLSTAEDAASEELLG